jgi:hypothetical protein
MAMMLAMRRREEDLFMMDVKCDQHFDGCYYQYRCRRKTGVSIETISVARLHAPTLHSFTVVTCCPIPERN